jgi:hypothetical protein
VSSSVDQAAAGFDSSLNRVAQAAAGFDSGLRNFANLTRPITLPDIKLIRPPNPAKLAVEAIYEEIADFEASLDENHEMGLSIVGGPAGVCLHVREVYRYGTDKLVFNGINSDGSPLRLVQHLSQLNFLMISAKKIGETAVRIGFHEPTTNEDA